MSDLISERLHLGVPPYNYLWYEGQAISPVYTRPLILIRIQISCNEDLANPD